MTLIDKETIRKEIKRQKSLISGLFSDGDDSFYDAQDSAYNRILTFLDTIPEQPEMELDNHTIMEEIRKCGCNPNEFDVARHFYELGLNSKK